MLPVTENKFLISSAIDFINNQQYSPNDSQKLFKKQTNFPNHLRLQEGAHVVKFRRVAFSVVDGIVDIGIKKETVIFQVDGKPASRCQFPLQNAFALIVHKTQGLTLPDKSMLEEYDCLEKIAAQPLSL
ncbi:hypothetical protein C1645_818248 [Glomus cerebriforme]|uniref:Uncharacterized protein n=1 Tax=Glomus cerebriforme TaxID=658196 RepID=A0A397T8Q2_9GLOM|nr:hypothetical protein C1645_818248 [Glomus cerebriforme]